MMGKLWRNVRGKGQERPLKGGQERRQGNCENPEWKGEKGEGKNGTKRVKKGMVTRGERDKRHEVERVRNGSGEKDGKCELKKGGKHEWKLKLKKPCRVLVGKFANFSSFRFSDFWTASVFTLRTWFHLVSNVKRGGGDTLCTTRGPNFE